MTPILEVKDLSLSFGALRVIDNLSFQLQPGELREEFASWKILFYSEGLEPGTTRHTARIVAQLS